MLRSAQTVVVCPDRGRRLTDVVADHGRLAVADLRNVPRYVLRTLIGVVALCGLLSLWGLHGDGTMPSMFLLSGIDPYRISSSRCIAEETSDSARWRGLAPALAILDRVNPTVAGWVRAKHDRGLMVFHGSRPAKGDPGSALAKYEVLGGRIIINRELFSENDGTIAVTLCHEYRHSRQNLGKFCQYVLSFLFRRGGDSSIIENDAVIFEQEAQNAIFTNARSRTRELAAWVASVEQERQRNEHRRMPPLSVSVATKAGCLP
jgi:hypothetical protein